VNPERISYHESVRGIYNERIKPDGITNIWDRYEARGLGGPRQALPLLHGRHAFRLVPVSDPVPFVTGAPNLVQLLTRDLPGVTGGVLHLETDATEAAAGMLAPIEENRKKLGI